VKADHELVEVTVARAFGVRFFPTVRAAAGGAGPARLSKCWIAHDRASVDPFMVKIGAYL